MTATIEYELSDSIGVLRICREDTHNSLGRDELETLDSILVAVDSDPEIRVLIVTGEGRQTFCSGAYLTDLNEGRITPHGFQSVMHRLAELRVPTIARVNGNVFGGGTELALSCDFRIGVESTRLRVPAAAIGLCYPPAGVARFVAKLGANTARRMLVASETLEATELFRIGFYDYLVESSALDDRVEELALHIAGLAPLAVAAMKELVMQAESGSIEFARAQVLVQACADSDDLQEGFAAQAERRAPRFEGR